VSVAGKVHGWSSVDRVHLEVALLPNKGSCSPPMHHAAIIGDEPCLLCIAISTGTSASVQHLLWRCIAMADSNETSTTFKRFLQQSYPPLQPIAAALSALSVCLEL
jgi:hypothetical protein